MTFHSGGRCVFGFTLLRGFSAVFWLMEAQRFVREVFHRSLSALSTRANGRSSHDHVTSRHRFEITRSV
jgi:hypothetical protein